MEQWHMTPNLEALAHTQSLLALPAQDQFLVIYPCSVVSWASPSLSPHHPPLEIKGYNHVTLVEGEAHTPHLPLPSAPGWDLGGSVGRVRCMPHAITEKSKAVVILTQSWQHYDQLGKELNEGLLSTPSPGTEFLGMEAEITKGLHVCCGLRQHTLGKRLTSTPTKLLLYHFALHSTNYISDST